MDIENAKYCVVVINPKEKSVTFCDLIPFEETVPGYRDHRIQSLPAALSRAGALRWSCSCLHFDVIRLR